MNLFSFVTTINSKQGNIPASQKRDYGGNEKKIQILVLWAALFFLYLVKTSLNFHLILFKFAICFSTHSLRDKRSPLEIDIIKDNP